jgi:hypothetical protein
LDDEPNVPAPNSPHREYYKGAAKTYGRADTFMDIFRQDKYAKDRENNVYYPFASANEWELASYITRSNMTVAATDDFLKLRLVRDDPLFIIKTTYDSRNLLDS